MKKETLILGSENFKLHVPTFPHPENPERYRRIVDHLIKKGYLISEIETSKDSLGLLLLAHSKKYVNKISRTTSQVKEKCWYLDYSKDTYISSSTMKAVTSALSGISSALQLHKKVDRILILNRPPGHHSNEDQASGFCIFNFASIAAISAANSGERVLIVDTDIHEGNGTQSIISKQEDKEIKYIGMHAQNHFPSTWKDKVGIQKRRFNITEVTLPMNTRYQDVEKLFIPELKESVESFDPTIIIHSCGFDGLRTDKISYSELSIGSYNLLGKQMSNIFKETPIISFLEGGYDLDNLGLCVDSFIEGICS